MKKVSLNRNEEFLKFAAIAIATLIVIPSIMIFDTVITLSPGEEPEINAHKNYIPEKPPEVRSILTENGIWVNVDGSDPGTPTECFVAVSDTSGITVVAEFNGFWRGMSGSVYMPGTTTMNQVGKPKLPRLIEYIEIPHDINVSLEVIYGVPRLLWGYNVLPAQAPVIPILNYTEDTSLTYDDAVYLSEEYFPSYNVSMVGESESSTIIMRGRRLLEISFYPIQYSPKSGNILFYPKFVVKAKYDEPAQIEPVEARLWSEPFENLFDAFILNYNSWETETGTGPGSPAAPTCPSEYIPASAISVKADYLIITHETFESQADKLAAWKTQKGLLAEVVTTAKIKNDYYPDLTLEEGIKALIQDAYDTWTIGPTYVLLFGDCEFVPNGYGTIHKGQLTVDEDTYVYTEDWDPFVTSERKRHFVFNQDPNADPESGSGPGRIGTDLFYFTVHGNDYVPDIIYSRISVDTPAQATVIVNKILSYEKSPPDNPDFYNNLLATSFFHDKDWDEEDPGYQVEDSGYQFVKYAEDVRLYLQNSLHYAAHLNYSRYSTWLDIPIGYTPRAFCDPVDPDNNPPIYFNDPRYDYSHLDLIDWIPYYPPNLGAENITDNINSDEGRFLVYYNDHGGSKNMIYPYDHKDDGDNDWDTDYFEGWSGLPFDVSDLPDLINGDLLPLFISCACNTGWFDGEIDESVLGELFDSEIEIECFSEMITRMAGGGAIAAIGASRHAYALESSAMLEGIIQAFWPGYLAWENQPIYGMGAALLLGKMNTAARYGYYDEEYEATSTTFQIYHLFGDPETELWTDNPSDLTVTYPTQMSTFGRQQFVVTVLNNTDPIYYAKVCIQGEDVYETGYTNSYGQAVFDIATSSTQSINVTVTKHNFIPHNGSIEVFDCEATFTEYPEQASAGDSVVFTVSGFVNSPINLYYNETHLGTFTGNTINPSIPEGRDGFANIKANATGEVVIILFKRYHGDAPVDPYVYSQNDRETWHLANGYLTYDNPSIEIYEMVGEEEEFRQSDALIQLSNYRVHVNVTNNLEEEVINAEVTLAWAMFSVGRAWYLINKEPVIIPRIEGLSWAETVIDWTPEITGHICLNATIFHINDVNEINNFGQENTDVAELESPGESWFLVGNPTDETSHVYLEVRQQCSLTDIWRAEIVGLSYLALPSGGYENISLQIIPPASVLEGELRLFTVSLYINGEYMGGLSIKGNKTTSLITTTGGLDPLTIALIGFGVGLLLVIVVVVVYRRKK